MTWMIWRQHRAEAFALLGFVAAIGVALLILGLPMHDLFPHGVGRCVTPPLDHECRVGVATLRQNHSYAPLMLGLFNFVPFAIGAFLGAPMLAREFEGGTWQLAWTQAVPRKRWLAAKIGALASLAVVLAAAVSAMTTWFREPLNLLVRFDITSFDVTGIVPAAYALFAFATAALAGALMRRSLPALATALVVFVAVRITVAGWVRPHYQSPITLAENVPTGADELRMSAPNPQDWVLDEGFADRAGHRFGELASVIWEAKARDAGIDPGTYLTDQGIGRWVIYHPAHRFVTFQLVEAALYVGLAVLLLGLLAWRVRRRAF